MNMRQDFGDSTAWTAGPDNLIVSIAIATYNGESFLKEQLLSIRKSCDCANINYEVVIVDDCSTDSTREVISSLSQLLPIRAYYNSSNIGQSKSFEKCLQLCNGDIVFTCDQDDIWCDEKVPMVLRSAQLSVGSPLKPFLFTGDAILVNEHNEPYGCTFFEARGAYDTSFFQNLKKFRHLGCSMAFSKDIIGLAIPFPSYIPQHDIWIYLVAKAHKVPFVTTTTPLMRYRRHSKNTSKAKLKHQDSGISYTSDSNIFLVAKYKLAFVLLYANVLIRKTLNARR